MHIVTNEGDNFMPINNEFDVLPSFFYQLFTIRHGIKNYYYVPLVFCLLPNKSTQTYVKAFQYLMSECQRYETYLSPYIYVYFEVSIQKTINIVLPYSNVKGCRFHLE